MNSGIMAQVRKTFSVEAVELLDPYVEVFLGGLKGSTSKKKRTMTPCWDEQIVFTMKFPLPPHPMVVQIRDDEILINHVVGTAVIHLDKISNSDSGGFLPTFGPCYVFLKESRNLNTNDSDVSYRGRLLMAISTEIINNPSLTKPYVVVEPTSPLLEGTYGQEVDFLLFACIRDATMIEKKVAEKPLRFTLQIGHEPKYETNTVSCAKRCQTGLESAPKSNWIEDVNPRESTATDTVPEYCSSFMQPITTNKKLYHLPIYEQKDCLWLKSSWLDCRRRIHISNILEKTCQKIDLCLNHLHDYIDMKISVKEETVEKLLVDLENSITYFLKLLKENWGIFSSKTQLDKERWKTYRRNLERVQEVTTAYRMMPDRVTIKVVFAKLENLIQELKNIKEDPQPSLPDVVLWMENNQKRIGFSKITSRDLLFAVNEEERGAHCGKITSLFFKPLSKRKNFVLAKVDVYLWLGKPKHFNYCLKGLPQGFQIDIGTQEREETCYIPHAISYYEKQIYQLQAHIYQARFLPWSDMSKFPSPVAQLFIGDRCFQTQIRENTLNPIWDETLIFNDLIFYGNRDEISQYSPDIVIEIHNYMVTGRSACLSRGVIPVMEKYFDGSPLLKWYNISSSDSEEPTQLLAAFELFPMLESGGDMFENRFYDLGPVLPIPPSIRPRFSPHRIEVLFWGLRELKRIKLVRIEGPRIELECSGSVIQSSIIPNYKKHSNFIKMIEMIDLELPEREAYFPAMTIRLLDCKSFGRRTVIASHVIHHLQKYVVKPNGELLQPKYEDVSKTGNEHDERDTIINVESSEQYPPYDSYIIQNVRIPWTYSKPEIEENGEEVEQDWWSRYYISSEETSQSRKFSTWFPRTSMTGRRSTFGCPIHTTGNVSENTHPKVSIIANSQAILKEFGDGFVGASRSNNLDAKGFIVYPCELENVPEFGGFEEWLHSFALTRGRKFARFFKGEKTVSIFKGCFRIYQLPLPPFVVDPLLPISEKSEGLFHGLPENKPTKVLVRVYIVEAVDLAPSDVTNTTDAYIVIQIGNMRYADKENYVSKQLSPVFGKCFEFVANFPSDFMLHIQIMDWDLMGADDLIGETKIDLENRFYSRSRPTCGLARTYEMNGPNAWRDVHTPTEILTNLCKDNGLGTPQITETDVRIANIVYDFSKNPQDNKASEQDMALYLLHRWSDISVGKYSLVPEHMETRTLLHPSKPGESQGKLLMWVDMFPEDSAPPSPPRDISKRKPVSYELRVIIWNTDEVVLSDDAFFTGEKMSDIYVKGWLTGKEDVQRTDVHYRSLTGEGNFNWRFVFPFDYLPIERKMIVMKKVTVFSWDETEFKMPPELKLQIFDADHFKSDDFLGELILDLRQFPRGAKSSNLCSLEMLKDDGTVPQIWLFKQPRIKGWWPVSIEQQNGERLLTGKVEAELHLLKKDEAEKSPAGLGRKEPDPLPEPKRPETSFANFLHPLKTFRYALWKRYKRTIIQILIIAAVALILLLFVYSAPGYTAKKILGA